MKGVAWLLIVLSLLGFILAVVSALTDPIIGIEAEGYSRACGNLAMIAIALLLLDKK